MKKIVVACFVLCALICFSSCEKCYRCHNLCKTCTYTYTNYTDTTLTITVCSDKLSMKYYDEYVDSITAPSLGWVCTDAASNHNEQFCGTASANNVQLINKKDAGLVCAAE